jgi:hypothetical protein
MPHHPSLAAILTRHEPALHGAKGKRADGLRLFIAMAIGLLMTVSVCGCASFIVTPLEDVGFMERLQRDGDEEVRVAVAVLTAEESHAAFGVPLAKRGVQPVWVEVENDLEQPVWLWTVGLDPEYFSPIESAFYFRKRFSTRDRQRLYEHFSLNRFHNPVPPRSVVSGFVFANLDRGVKNVNVDLLTFGEKKQFSFIVTVPGLDIDDPVERLQSLYSPAEITDFDDLEALRGALEELPARTTNRSGRDEGDPINFFLIGHREEVFPPFIRRNWHQTEFTTAWTAMKTAASSVFGTRYRYSPISPLYYFGRPQDLGGQKARGTVNERNHLRLWLTPLRFQGRSVWAGAISRDIGVKLTTRSPTLTTHVIDPDLDETRGYLLQDLMYSHAVARIGYVRGGEVSTIDDPLDNLTKDPFITDGLRLVLFLTDEPTAPWEVELLGWEIPERTREAIED